MSGHQARGVRVEAAEEANRGLQGEVHPPGIHDRHLQGTLRIYPPRTRKPLPTLFLLFIISSSSNSRLDVFPPSLSLAQMEIGDKVFLRDLDVPKGVRVSMKDDKIPIIKLVGKGR